MLKNCPIGHAVRCLNRAKSLEWKKGSGSQLLKLNFSIWKHLCKWFSLESSSVNKFALLFKIFTGKEFRFASQYQIKSNWFLMRSLIKTLKCHLEFSVLVTQPKHLHFQKLINQTIFGLILSDWDAQLSTRHGQAKIQLLNVWFKSSKPFARSKLKLLKFEIQTLPNNFLVLLALNWNPQISQIC